MDQSVQTIFIEARQLAAAERDNYLRAACGGDAELREKVESLLAADAEAGSFLKEPSTPTREQQAFNDPMPGTQSLEARSGERSASTMIGPYKLLQQIGEGGMGSVWMAEQTEPIQRRVALKVIKAGMDSRQVIARFEAERQALAMMDHPHIAKVFDAGTTSEGGPGCRPYFVMELVKGVPITKFCDEQHLSPRGRLELFLPVCQAVQHAHQKGIIHRDLKPTNILVTLFDGKPMPKVIDFGLAKATSQRLTDKTMFTEFGQIVGTLEYMSPEQARFDQLDVDTRSDIYSLGVVLYELLVGETPFDRHRLHSAAFDELLRIIREEDPPHLSMKLSGSGSLPSIAANRGTEPKHLSALVRGELDWIVMKSLDKDRARRYETANDLARDVERYLADETVEACPPSARYRLGKFFRRNKGPVLASAAFLFALFVGVIGTTMGMIGQARERTVAEQQRSLAEEQAQEAKQQAAIAEAVSQFQSDMLGSADPDNLLGDQVTVLQVITAAVKELDNGKLKDQPLVEASLRQMIGGTLHGLGQLDAAEPNLRKALELRRKAMPATDPLVAYSAYSFAVLLGDHGRFAEAEPLYCEAVEIARRRSSSHSDLAACLLGLAGSLKSQGRYAEAEPLYKEALAIQREALPAGHADIAAAVSGPATLLSEQGRLSEAEPMFREALAIRRNALPAGHPNIALSLESLAKLLGQAGTFAEAEPLYREALEINRKAMPAGHPIIGASLGNLAGLLQAQGQLAEAEPLFREALRFTRQTFPPGHKNIGVSLTNLAGLLQAQGKLAEAEPLFREAVAIFRQALPVGHPDTATSLHNLAWLLEAQGEFVEAEPLAREALAMRRKALSTEHPDVAKSLGSLAGSLRGLGRLAEAEQLNREALEIRQKSLPAGHPDIAGSLNNIAQLLQEQDRLGDAEPLFREALEIRRKALPSEHPEIATSLNGLGSLLEKQGKLSEAEPLFLEAVETFERSVGTEHVTVGNARMGLGRVLAGLKRWADAESALIEAERVLATAQGVPKGRHEICVSALVDLYTAWDKAEPGKGYHEKARPWHAQLPTSEPVSTQAPD